MLSPWTPEEQAHHRADLNAALTEGETRGRHPRPCRTHQPADRTTPKPPKDGYAVGDTLEELLDAW